VKKGVAVIERSVLALSLDARDALEGPHQRVVLRASIGAGDAVIDALGDAPLAVEARADRTMVGDRRLRAREREARGSAARC